MAAIVYLDILILLLLIGLNGLLAMSELAVVSSSRVRLETLARDGVRGAQVALSLLDDPGRFLSTVQIGITLVGVLAGAFSAETLGVRLGTWLDRFPILEPYGNLLGIGITVLSVTYLSLTVGELVPKRIALSRPERVASLVSRPMSLLSTVAAPAVWLLQVSTEAMLRVMGAADTDRKGITEDEVRTLIAQGTESGVFAPEEKELIDGVLRLADRPVRAVMTPRPQLVWLDRHATAEEIIETVDANRHSRLLVCDGNVDQTLGIVHSRDLLPEALRGEKPDLIHSLRPLVYVPDGTPVLQLLRRFKEERVHLAVVVDEYGATSGLVTLNDILESIVGDLPERTDDSAPWIVQQDDGSWVVDGLLPTDELESETGIATGEKIRTVAGLVLEEMNRIPETGASFVYENAVFEVERMEGYRIAQVRIRLNRASD